MEQNIPYTEDYAEIKQQAETFYNEALLVNQAFHNEANIDARFNAGDQILVSEYYNIPLKTRKNFYVNRIRPVTNLIVGYQRANRKTIIVKPVELRHQQGADQYTKLMSAILRNADGYSIISEAYEGAVVTGLNLLEIYVDYSDDPVSGDIRIENCAYNSFFIDPYFRKKDLSDCNGILKRSFLAKETCKRLVPDKADEIDSFSGNYKDDKFNYMPEASRFRKDLLAYDEYYYRDYRKRVLLIDKQTEDKLEWRGTEAELREQLAQYPDVEVQRDEIPTVKLAILVNGHVVYNGENPLGIDDYPFVPVFGYFDPNLNDFSLRIQGVVRAMRDSQFLYNRRIILEQNSLEARANVGYIYKEDSLVDPQEPLNPFDGKMIRLKKGADMGDFITMAPQDIPESHFRLNEVHEKNLMYVSGANEELMGMAEDDKAAILAKLRQGQGLVTLQTLFDQLDNSLQNLGATMVQIIQNNYTPAKVMRILDEEPVQEFYDKVFAKYKISIEEGFDTATQRQEEFLRLIYLRDKGIEIPDASIIKAASLQNKDELINAINEQKQQAQQIQEQQAQINAQEQQATMNMMNARAQADIANARKRDSESEKDKFDMIKEAMDTNRQEQKSDLEAIKVLKDLEQSDPDKIDELVALMRIIQQERKEMHSDVKSSDLASPEDQFISGIQSLDPISQAEAPLEQSFQETMMQPDEQGLI